MKIQFSTNFDKKFCLKYFCLSNQIQNSLFSFHSSTHPRFQSNHIAILLILATANGRRVLKIHRVLFSECVGFCGEQMALTFAHSFLSSIPFSTAFRANKYCGELLNIGNEVWPEVHNEKDDSGERLEPFAEARTHLESFHQFTNLKIIKAESNESQQERKERPATSPRAKSKSGDSEIKTLNVEAKDKAPKNKVYSQVIR